MNPRSAATLTALVAAVLLAGPAAATERKLGKKEVVDLFAKLEKLNDAVKSVEAKVDKTIEDPELIDSRTTTQGLIRILKPDKIYMAIHKPAARASTLLVTKEEVRMYYPRAKPPRLEITRLGKGKGKGRKRRNKRGAKEEKGSLGDVLSGLSFKLDDMKKKFYVDVFQEAPAKADGKKDAAKKSVTSDDKKDDAKTSAETDDKKNGDQKSSGADAKKEDKKKAEEKPVLYRVELEPRDDQKRLLKMFALLQVWTDGKTAWVQKLAYESATGSVITTLAFSDVKLNIEIKSSTFAIKIKRGTKVVTLNP